MQKFYKNISAVGGGGEVGVGVRVGVEVGWGPGLSLLSSSFRVRPFRLSEESTNLIATFYGR